MRKRAGKFNLASEVQYFSGDCNDPATQREIQEAFIQLLSDSDLNADVCEGVQDCRAENVVVTCGETRQRRGDLGGRRRRRSLRDAAVTRRDFEMLNYGDHMLLREAEDHVDKTRKRSVAMEIFEEERTRRDARRPQRITFNRERRSVGAYFVTISFQIVADIPNEVQDDFEYEDTAYSTIDTLYNAYDYLTDKAMEGALVPNVSFAAIFTYS